MIPTMKTALDMCLRAYPFCGEVNMVAVSVQWAKFRVRHNALLGICGPTQVEFVMEVCQHSLPNDIATD
jgi:hypothetical protein